MNASLKDWALYYAEKGLAVFPLEERGKRPITKNGCKAATTNKEQIAEWWSCYPNSNIGIATGRPSGGLVVIDLDEDEEKDKHGYEVLKEWQQSHEDLPETWQSITGRGGYHLFFKDTAHNQNRVNLYDGIDIRGDGGYIVAPPSVHENGRRYEWEIAPEDQEIASVNSVVADFLLGPLTEKHTEGFQEPESIPQGQRVATLIKLIGSQRAKGLSTEAIRAAVRAENEARCIPPLTDQELEREVFPSLKRDWKSDNPYTTQAVCDRGKSRQIKTHSVKMSQIGEIQEKEPDWLISGYVPRYQITSLAGDGGSGKTTVWCALAAAVSAGKKTFLETLIPDRIDSVNPREPQKVLFFSAEDSAEYTLKRRLRKNGANLENIIFLDVADDRFQDVKFNSLFLEAILKEYCPALCIFDPIQAFVPPDIRMGDRNAMRNCLAPLIGYGEKYGTTFLIIEHANKQSGVWGRKRIADSADIWDISRSVIMAGETNRDGIRYLSHEKSNYDQTRQTVLYSIEDEVICFKGYTSKKDKDFVAEAVHETRGIQPRQEAKEFILDFLKDGEKEVAELDEMAKVNDISKNAMREAKSELRQEGKTKMWSIGYGSEKKHFISLLEGSLTGGEKTNK